MLLIGEAVLEGGTSMAGPCPNCAKKSAVTRAWNVLQARVQGGALCTRTKSQKAPQSTGQHGRSLYQLLRNVPDPKAVCHQ